MVKKLFPDPAPNLKSLIQFVFYVRQGEGSQNILKLFAELLHLPHKAFRKNKTRPGTSPPVSFCVWFLKKKIALVIFY